MKQDLFNEIVEKAKNKPDGVFSHKKTLYGVKNKVPVVFCDYFGQVFQCYCGFLHSLGKTEKKYTNERKKELLELLFKL